MTKDELIAQQAEQISALKFELAQLKKLIYGAKQERFVAEDTSHQGSLFDPVASENPPSLENITYQRQKRKSHPGRNALPDHLPVEQVIIEPDEDTTGMKKIGEQRTETLKYTPASLVKKITIRPQYARPQDQGIVIAPLPERPIDKSIAEASLLAHIFTAKFIDHLPFYRQIQQFKRQYNWQPASSTLSDWFLKCCELLVPLYDYMLAQIMAQDYIQADESPIKVLDGDKPGATHQGYQWVYHSPEQKIVIFRYRKGRGQHGPKETLAHYQGYLQCDGYTVYDKIGAKKGIELVGCWAHLRRKFYDAKDSDEQASQVALKIIQQIYHHERQAKDFSAAQRWEYRNIHTVPLMDQLKVYLDQQALHTLPKSPLGKAITYAQKQWPKLIAVNQDGRLAIDNNWIENKIRPLALGRKNYLFAGSHRAAQGIALFYSFFGTCKARRVNPYDWLKDTLERIKGTKLSELGRLMPLGDR